MHHPKLYAYWYVFCSDRKQQVILQGALIWLRVLMAIPQLATQARNRQVFSMVTGLPEVFWMIWMLICVQLCELMMCRKLQKLVPTQEATIECWCQLLSYKTFMFWQSHNIQSDSRLGQLRLGVHYCFEQKAVILLISAILEDRNQWVYRYTRYRREVHRSVWAPWICSLRAPPFYSLWSPPCERLR